LAFADMKNARIEFSTHWPLLPLHRAACEATTEAPAVIVPIRVATVGAEPPCAYCAKREAVEPVPPSVIERPLRVGDGEDAELAEFLKPPALPWERSGGRP
jgi:hypothetical protein